MAYSLNDHNGSADVDAQLGSYRFSRFVTKSTHFPHSHSFSLSSSLWKVLNTFFPRNYNSFGENIIFLENRPYVIHYFSSHLHFTFEALESLFFTVSRLFNWWFSLCFFPGNCWFFFLSRKWTRSTIYPCISPYLSSSQVLVHRLWLLRIH